ncbi:HAD-like domain-containing protein [Sporodiniella umbellata]|nr:HAD-like domain-containing protein [Sporodiniella umbellata]
MSECGHQVQYNGLCALCGAMLESLSEEEKINMSYDNIGLTVSRSEAERLEQENVKRLLQGKKLSLILDLDQTIVHASCDPRISQWKNDDIRRFTLPKSPTVYYIKLRPGLTQFLTEIEKLFDLHIYTMGTKDYAKAVAKEMDPEGKLFKERILSRDESGCLTQKSLKRIFPCDTSMVVVLDDRADVWSNSPNLVRIKPYEYFVGTGDINNPAKLNNKEEDKQEETKKEEDLDVYKDEDVELYTMLDILKRIHQEFYRYEKHGDVTTIIPSLKRSVLADCNISFAPEVLYRHHRDPNRSGLWHMASSFGAGCSTDLTGKTTHLITIQWDAKAKTAKEYGHSKIVTPAWLLDSTARWKVQNEEAYVLQDAELSDIENPDSVSLEDHLFDEKEDELVENVDWDEVNKELEDFLDESGADTDGDTTDSESVSAFPVSKENR